jgi:hypothetical protein
MKKIILSIITITILTISCKKENSSTNSNIFSKQVNVTVTAVLSGLDSVFSKEQVVPLTGDVGEDFTIWVRKDIHKNSSSTSLMINGLSDRQLSGTNYELKTLNLNDVINTTSNSWANGAGLGNAYYKLENSILTNIIPPGSGDKYLGLKLKLSDNTTHYGWLIVNYSVDGLSLTVKEFAYNKNANEEIKAGQK